jgi:hypothetical protein
MVDLKRPQTYMYCRSKQPSKPHHNIACIAQSNPTSMLHTLCHSTTSGGVGHRMQCSALGGPHRAPQRTAAQHSTSHHSTAHDIVHCTVCGTTQRRTAQHRAWFHCADQHSTAQHNARHCFTAQRCTASHSAVQHNTYIQIQMQLQTPNDRKLSGACSSCSSCSSAL